MKTKYINPFTDFGFKKLFGEESSKAVLMDFLNALLPEENRIKDLVIRNTEQLAASDQDRKSVFDIYCESQEGERFIVELQNTRQTFFKDRTIYYSTFAIREQVEKGIWDFGLNAVYCISVLDFRWKEMEPGWNKNKVVHRIKLKDEDGDLFYDKLTYLYVEMPNFTLGINELKTPLDKWLYIIKNMKNLKDMPASFKDSIFESAFEKAEMDNLNSEEFNMYQRSLKAYRDYHNGLDYAFKDGLAKGEALGITQGITQGIAKGEAQGEYNRALEMAKRMKAANEPLDKIMLYTGLTAHDIETC